MAKSRYKDMSKYRASLKKTAEANKARREAEKAGVVKKGDGKHLSHAENGGAKVESSTTNVRRPRNGKGSKAPGKGSYSTELNARRGRPPKKGLKHPHKRK